MSPFWISPAIASALTMAVAIEPPQNSEAIGPDLNKAEVLDIIQDRHQRYTIPVTIDGVGPFNFMIDTGSQATVVTHEINDLLSLPSLGTATLVGMSSIKTVPLVEVDNLQMGSQLLQNLSAPVLERDHIGADGIIGLDSLQDSRVLIDFRNETIAVENISKGRGRNGFEIVVKARSRLGRLLITDAVIEGIRTTVVIDSGAQGSIGNLALRDKVRARRELEVATTDVNGVTALNDMSIARRLSIQDISLTNVAITYADAPAFEVLGLKDKPALSLGMQQLRLFDRIAIDFANRRVLFDLPREVEHKRFTTGSIL